MARHVEGPWYRAAKNAWYVTLNGRSVALGVRGGGNRAEAVQAWHRLMGGLSAGRVEPEPTPKPKPQPAPEPPTQSAPTLTVAGLISAYLADADGRVSEEWGRGLRKFLRPFAERFGERSAESITPAEAEGFSRRPDWSATYRAGFLSTLAGAYRWAVRDGLLKANPVAHVRKPVRRSRGTQTVLTAAEHARLTAAADPDTADLLALLWATGARPGEVAGLTAEMVRASADGVIPLAEHKSAHRGKARTLILSGEAWEIARRRAEAAGSGLILTGRFGGRLTAQAIGCRVRKLCRRVGLRHLIPYGYRHTLATDALAAGVPDAQVAALLGHAGTQMLHRHYSHLTSRTDVLRAAAARVR